MIPLLVALLSAEAQPGPPAAASRVVLFARGPGTTHTLVVPIACLSAEGALVAAANADCLGFVPAKAQVFLDSGEVATASDRVIATCAGDAGPPRDALELSGGPFRFSYAVWPPAAGPSIARVVHRPPDNLPIAVPPAELKEVRGLVGRHARGDVDVLQRFDSDLDGDGAKDVGYSVDVRCTPQELLKRAGRADGEPRSCFNGLIVRWGGSARFVPVARDWDRGQIAAIFDLDGDRRPEVLVFAQLDAGFRRQVFTIDRRALKPHDPWCCGCAAQAKTPERHCAPRGIGRGAVCR